MRKYLFFVGATAMMLASCTSEGVVNPGETPAAGNEVPMLFSSHRANMSRDAVNMETENYAFGVSAYKTSTDYLADLQDVSEITVMNNYLVGYWDKKTTDWEGYKPLQGQVTPTNWYYELLGKEDAGYEFKSAKGFTAVDNTNKNPNKNQYLKYWDLSKNSTFFFGYAPYGSATVTPAKDKATISFGEITTGPGETYMYGATRCTNADYIFDSPTATPKYVDIEFKHFLAQVRMAFYNSIPGYEVELIDYSTANSGVVAVPAVPGTPYTKGSYYDKCSFEVEYTYDSANDKLVDTQTFTTGSATTQDNLVCPIDYFFDGDGAQSSVLGDDYDKKIVSAPYNVVPQANTCGFTVNVSFKLTAKDTGEVLYIRGARVFIPATYCNWVANNVYTYVFRLTTKSSGSTGDTTPTISPDPTTNLALWPIIFDKVTIADMDNGLVNDEWDINPGIDDAHKHDQH